MASILTGTFATLSGATYSVDSLMGSTFVTVSGSSLLPDGVFAADSVEILEGALVPRVRIVPVDTSSWDGLGQPVLTSHITRHLTPLVTV